MSCVQYLLLLLCDAISHSVDVYYVVVYYANLCIYICIFHSIIPYYNVSVLPMRIAHSEGLAKHLLCLFVVAWLHRDSHSLKFRTLMELSSGP